jgi:L-malate glycosyltransferase
MTRRIRLVYCLDNMDIGGTELNAVRTVERLDRDRFAVSIVCFRDEGPLRSRYEAAGVDVLTLRMRSFHGASTVKQGLRFARYLRAERVDIVHSHDMYSNVFAVPWARAARTPVVMASRRWWQTLPAFHLRAANTVAFRMAHCVLANSPAVAASVQASERVPARRVAVISNFVAESAFASPPEEWLASRRAELGLPSGALVVGCVARLVPVKDHASLLHAVARLKQDGRWSTVHVVLVGGGECRDALAEQARALGIEGAVHFAGEQLDGGRFHHLFDVSVLCSLSEGFPNSIVEAMAAGRPVVATAVGGSVDAVRDPETGVLVSPRNPAQLADAIERLLQDSALRGRMGAAGRELARTGHGEASVIASLESLYDRLLGGAAA